MKVCLILLLTLVSSVCGDQASSSYAVLPYEDEYPHSNHITYETPQHHYDYDDYDDSKKGFNFGKIMKVPFKALQGAGNYMKWIFDDFSGKFKEFKGSMLRGQGQFLETTGENILRDVYAKKAKGNFYPIPSYHPPPNGYHQRSSYNPNPARVVPYGMEDPPAQAHKYSESILNGVGKPDHAVAHKPTHGDHLTEGFGSPYTASTNHRRREFVEQRSSRSFARPWRTQRAYSTVGHVEDPNPIPVPVPIHVAPSRLIFPTIHNIHYGGGYH